MEYKKYAEIIDKILNAFEIPEKFGQYYGNERIDFNFAEYSNKIKKAINKITPITICSGVSKMVIVPKKYPFVIKIPFNGSFLLDTESIPDFWQAREDLSMEEMNLFYEEAAEKRDNWIKTHLKEITYFEPFEYACDDDSSDYCLDELQKYEIIKEKNFAPFFAETYYYTSKDGTNIYIQEKAIAYEDKTTSQIKISRESLEKAKNIQDNSGFYVPDPWLATALECYGEKFVTNFFNYATEDEDELRLWEDMHNGNLGYRLDGTPCFIDFSGWRD